MTTVSTSFTSTADSATLSVASGDETITVSLSGSYAGTTELQKQVGRGAWQTQPSGTWSTANATVVADFNSGGPGTAWRLRHTFTSGTCVTTLADGDKTINAVEGTVRTQAGVTENGTLTVTGATTLTGALAMNATATQAEGFVRSANTVVAVTTATLAVTEALHAGRTMTLQRAAGIIITLPAATGTGNVYRFIVEDTTAGATHITGLTGDILTGVAIIGDTTTPGEIFTPDGTDLILDLYGTSNNTGGLKGAVATFTDIATDLWHCDYFSIAATQVTPFK